MTDAQWTSTPANSTRWTWLRIRSSSATFDGLKTGDEVTYDNGGGTSIGGLTDDDGTTKYYVIKLADGKIQLATSLANAEAGTAIDLTDQGAGDTHKLDRTGGDDITFDPDKKRVELSIAEDLAWVTGEAVVYDNNGNPNIGDTGDADTDNELVNGTTYFVIAHPEGKIKLAKTPRRRAGGQGHHARCGRRHVRQA